MEHDEKLTNAIKTLTMTSSLPSAKRREVVGVRIVTTLLVVLVLCAFIAANMQLTSTMMSRFASFDDEPNNTTHRQLQVLEQFRLSEGKIYPDFEVYNEMTGETLSSLAYENEANPLNNLADSRTPPYSNGPETAFFFHIRKSRGGVVKNIMTHCFNLRRAEKMQDPESLTFVDGVLNVDTQTLAGLKRAQGTNIVDSGLVDVIVSSYFFEGMMLFNPTHKGRVFTLLPHPVYQTESLYLSLKQRHPAKFNGVGIEDWVQSDSFNDNWVVRSLINYRKGALTEEHVTVAKVILSRKFVVGISQYPLESMKRLVMYYGWNEVSGDGSFECMHHFMNQEVDEDVSFEGRIERGSERWNLLTSVNKYDMELYYFALQLFAKQGSTLFGRPYVDKTGAPIDFAKLRAQREQEQLEQFFNSLVQGGE